jgi:hypothetical protein
LKEIIVKEEAKQPGTGGGSATNAGIEYQAGVMAWVVAHIMAGHGAELPFILPVTGALIAVSLETQEPVDDLNVETLLKGSIFIQAKRGVQLSTGPDSDLGKTLCQFVNQ